MSQENHSGAYYYSVKGLSIPPQAPQSIGKDIDHYVGSIGRYKECLEDCFNRKDTDGFIDTLEIIRTMLRAVYAKQYSLHVGALISCAKLGGLDDCQRLLQQTVTDLLLLSIEMQKAQILGASHALAYRQAEIDERLARGFSAIGTLLDIGDYEMARNMASDMKDVDAPFVKLADMLASCQYGEARELADAMEKAHIGHIQQTGTDKTLKTVLAVDDRPEILSYVNAALRGHYKVLCAPSGKIALQIILRQKPDLFYLDIEMPEMDGFELAAQIRADAAHADTPIIFLTGNAPREHIEKGIRLGVNDFIVKPSNHISLLVKARTHLDNSYETP
jgi:CheY-like chemotaxis protein